MWPVMTWALAFALTIVPGQVPGKPQGKPQRASLRTLIGLVYEFRQVALGDERLIDLCQLPDAYDAAGLAPPGRNGKPLSLVARRDECAPRGTRQQVGPALWRVETRGDTLIIHGGTRRGPVGVGEQYEFTNLERERPTMRCIIWSFTER